MNTQRQRGLAGRRPCIKSFLKINRAARLTFSVFVALAASHALFAQETRHSDSNGNSSPSYQETFQLGKRKPGDIVSDNVAHVAATPEQILGVLNRDPGLMVEMKRLYAEQAGLRGQILEETDLSDSSLAEQLRQDLRLRALATKLLQRYGYLLPRINPDSDLADEHTLYLRQRAQDLERARLAGGMQATTPQIVAPCDPRTDTECALQLLKQTQNPAGASSPAPSAPAPSSIPPQSPPRDYSPQAPELRADAPQQQPQSAELLLAAGKNSDAGSALPGSSGSSGQNSSRSPVSSIAESPFPPLASPAEALGGGNGYAVPANSPPVNPELLDSLRSNRELDRYLPARAGSRGMEELEPVAMVHKPNPYASVPALYDLYVQASPGKSTQRFGTEVFQKGIAKTDVLPMDLPVGPDYVLGPGDSLAIDLWGGVSQRLLRTVDRQGLLVLPEAGPVLVAGKPLGEVQSEVQRLLRTQFRDVSADVSLLKLRSVRVYVVGEVANPGAYDVSSLSTPLNALFTAGGVTSRGSLRKLQHYRGNQLIEEVDGYDLLLRGIRGQLRRLENGDSLRVPPLGPIVTVEGMVRRPSSYELRSEKNLEDVLDLAGGILPAAALRHIEVQRLVAHEKHTMFSLDLGTPGDSEEVRKRMREFNIQDGDQIHIFPIAPYNTSSVFLEGHVLLPGRYSYREGMTLRDLVSSYKDLLPEPSLQYAEIIRLKAPDYRPVVEAFNLQTALAEPEDAPKLAPLDTVRIFGRFDFESAPEVLVTGEVREPGRYRMSGQQHLRDVLFQAGGVTPEAWLDSAQVFRRLPDGSTRVYSVNLNSALEGNAPDNLSVEPRDRIVIQRQPGLESPETVYVEGDVAHPGRYPFAANMRASDLVRAAGGALRSANPENGKLVRYVANGKTNDTTTVTTPVNVASAMDGVKDADTPLKPGDVLTIPQRNGWKDIGASVAIRGEVKRPGTYGIRPGERLSAVLKLAGGFNGEAYPYAAVLTRPPVRDVQMKEHIELVQRVRMEQLALKGLPENDADQKNAKLTAVAQAQTALQQLESITPIGRVVIHVTPNIKEWENTGSDPIVQDGDVVVIPKKPNYVTVAGQVFNPTAINYRPGRSAKWYLQQAGGMTQLANKQASFVVRADGSVVAAKNNSGWWSGDPMGAVLRPGDSIIVPERAAKIGGRNWTPVLQMAQIAASVGIAAAYTLK